MSLSRDSRQERKLKAYLRAKFALKQRFEKIDHEEDVVQKEVDAFKRGGSVLELPAGVTFDLTVVDEDSTDDQTD